MGGGDAAEVYGRGEIVGSSCVGEDVVAVTCVAVEGRIVTLGFLLNNLLGGLGGASCGEPLSVAGRMFTFDFRLKSRCGTLGTFSCDEDDGEGDGGEELVESMDDCRMVALDFRLKSCILASDILNSQGDESDV